MKLRSLAVAGIMVLVAIGSLVLSPAGASSRGSPPNADSEPNGNFANATMVYPGGGGTITIHGHCDVIDVNDYYKIRLNLTIPNAEKLVVNTTVATNDPVRLFLYDPNGMEMVLDGDPNFTQVHRVSTVAAVTGDYYLRYECQVFQGTADYNITFSKTTVTYTGDTNGTTATAVPVSSVPVVFNGNLDDPGDQADFYCITLSCDSSAADVVTFVATPVGTLSVFVEVYYPNFTYNTDFHYDPLQPGQPPLGQKHDGSFGARVAGTHFIRVLAVDGTGTYTLRILRTSVAKDGYDTAATAYGLPAFANNHWLIVDDTYSTLGKGVDVADYFSFPASEGQVVNATLRSLDYDITIDRPQISMELRDSTDTTSYGSGAAAKNTTRADGISPESTTASLIKVNLADYYGGAGRYTINITVNIVPMIYTDKWETPFTVNESASGIMDLTTVFYDDDGDTLTYTAVNNGAGKLRATFTGNGANFSCLEPGWTGLENFTVTATDPFGYSTKANIHASAVAVNHAPYIIDGTITDVTMTAGEIRIDTFNLSDNFYDSDRDNIALNDHLTFHHENDGPLIITFQVIKGTLYQSGAVTIQVPVMADLVTEFTQAVNFWATDAGNLSTTKLTCNITVEPRVNNAPRWSTAFSELQMNESTELTIDLVNYCADSDPWDTGNLTFRARGYNATALTVTITGSQAKIKPAAGVYSYTGENITFNVTDTRQTSAETTIRLIIKHIYVPPAWAAVSPSNATVEMNEGANQTFVADAKLDPLIARAVPMPVSILWYVNGTIQSARGNNFTYRTDFSSSVRSPYNITVKLNDSVMEMVKSWKVNVINVNQPPTGVKISTPTNGQNVTQGNKVDFRAAQASDPDNANATLTYVWKDGVKELGRGQTISYSKLAPGSHTITLEVTDEEGATTTDSVTIKVKAYTAPKPFLPGFELVGLLAAIALVGAVAMSRRRN